MLPPFWNLILVCPSTYRLRPRCGVPAPRSSPLIRPRRPRPDCALPYPDPRSLRYLRLRREMAAKSLPRAAEAVAAELATQSPKFSGGSRAKTRARRTTDWKKIAEPTSENASPTFGGPWKSRILSAPTWRSYNLLFDAFKV